MFNQITKIMLQDVINAINTIENPVLKREFTADRFMVVGTVLNGLEAIIEFTVSVDDPYWILRGNRPTVEAAFKVDGERLFYNLNIEPEDYPKVVEVLKVIEDQNEADQRAKVSKLWKQLDL